MTMHPPSPMAHLSSGEYNAIIAEERQAAAKLASAWGVDAVGREYPRHVTRADGYSYAKPGRWYVIVDGARCPATAAQSRALNRTGVAHGVCAVLPILAAA